MSSVLNDLRASALRLTRAPAFVVLAVGSLAVGFAMVVAFAAVAWTLAYAPLPLPSPDRLVALWTTESDNDRGQSAAGNFAALRRSAESFEAIAAYSAWNLVVSGPAEAERVHGALVSGDFFAVLGLAPLGGRALATSDDVDGQDRVAVLSETAARRWFGSAESAVGRDLKVNGVVRVVVGVMPAGRVLLPEAETDLWIPLGLAPAAAADTSGGWLRVVGRLRDGVTIAAAGHELTRLTEELRRLDPIRNGDRGLRMVPLREELSGGVEGWLTGFAAAVALLGVLVTVNFVGLVRVRRESEAAAWWVREMVGAEPSRLRRLRALEGMWIGLMAAMLGGGGAAVLLRGLEGVDLLRSPVGRGLGLPWWAWLGASAAVVVLGAAGAVARHSTGLRSTPMTNQRTILGVRRSVVVVQLALAMPLLIGCALLHRSLSFLRAEPLGFDSRQVVAASLSFSRSRYATAREQAAVVERVLEGLRAVPGVAAAEAVSDLPLGGNHMAFDVTLESQATVKGKSTLGSRLVTAGYFQALSIPLRDGRLFSGSDDGQAERVAILNEAAARALWPVGSALGNRLRLGDETGWLRVVGVVGDVHHMGVVRGELPAIYLPLAQKPFDWMTWTTVVVRSGAPGEGVPAAVRAGLQAVVRAVDPEMPVYDVRTMDELRDREFAPRVWLRWLLIGFSAVATLLVALGIYGVTALFVTSRRREIGVRAALGASPLRAVALVVRQVAVPAVSGASLGLLIWLAAGRVLETQFFRVESTRIEGLVFALTCVLASASAAALVPALRAWRANPAVLLRES